MKIVQLVILPEVEYEFLRAEWYKLPKEVQSNHETLLVEPDFNNEHDNFMRSAILLKQRCHIFHGLPGYGFIPGRVDWYRAELEKGDFSKLLVIREIGWENTFGKCKNVEEAVKYITLGEVQDRGVNFEFVRGIKDNIGKYPFEEKLILIGLSPGEPLTIFEGNHRALAFQLHYLEHRIDDYLPKEVVVGLSSDMKNSLWYNNY